MNTLFSLGLQGDKRHCGFINSSRRDKTGTHTCVAASMKCGDSINWTELEQQEGLLPYGAREYFV